MGLKSNTLAACLLGAAALSFSACGNAGDNAQQANADAAKDAVQNTVQQAMAAPPAGAMGMGPPAGGMGAGMAPPPDESSSLIPSAQVTYKTVEGKDLKLHVFNPVGHKAGDNRAALIFYHGGGFRAGSPQAGYDLSEALNAKGVVLIAAEYRLTGTDGRTLDQIMSDAKSSVRYVRSHASELGIDPNKIVSSGHSAGAYLGATNGMIDGFDQAGEDMSVSSMSNAMILWSMGSQRSERNTGEIMGEGRTLADYQPRAFLDGDLPPSIFIHGDQDTLIAYGPTQEFANEVKAQGNQTEFVLIEGADHFFRAEPQRSEAIAAMVEFMGSLGFTAH